MRATKFELHHANLELAREELAKHVVEEDGARCFNLANFLLAVESRLDTVLCGNASPAGRFELSPWDLARYLWCCLALESGDAPDGNTFRGMPILDF